MPSGRILTGSILNRRQHISVVYPHAGLLPSRVSAFVQWIKQELGKTQEDFVGHLSA